MPGSGNRSNTCYPDNGEPKELDFFLVSHCLKNSVREYQAMSRGAIPTHRPVKLTLRLAGQGTGGHPLEAKKPGGQVPG
eukprot:1519697-Heterocapsa_arctica.AAC.1